MTINLRYNKLGGKAMADNYKKNNTDDKIEKPSAKDKIKSIMKDIKFGLIKAKQSRTLVFLGVAAVVGMGGVFTACMGHPILAVLGVAGASPILLSGIGATLEDDKNVNKPVSMGEGHIKQDAQKKAETAAERGQCIDGEQSLKHDYDASYKC